MDKDNQQSQLHADSTPLKTPSFDERACQKSLLKTWCEIPIQLKSGGLFQEATFAVGYRLG